MPDTLFSRLEANCKIYGHLPAIIALDGNLTYRELSQRIHQLAAKIQEHKATNAARIVVYMAKKAEAIIAFLAINAIGAVYVPIDASQPVEYAKKIIHQCHASLLITDKQIDLFESCNIPSINIQPALAEETEKVSLHRRVRSTTMTRLTFSTPPAPLAIQKVPA
jgi:acyl-CoA synthetase (AMP-forming)/AMP-acid ligase II